MRSSARWLWLSAVGVLAATAVARADDDPRREWQGVNLRIVSPVVRTHYDGQTDDLLTAGLGKAGLQGGAPPVSSPPTAEELRRLAIYNNYRALVDVADGGGYGVFWGPNVRADGTVTNDPGLIAGDETLAFALQPDGSRITLMVQVPDSFDPARACIVAGPSSGSRGVYGAIATAGEWGLKNGCAVAYTDKGSGTGFDDLQNSLVTTLRGEVAPIASIGQDSQFTAPISPSQRSAFDAAYPNRFAFKHAHSEVNPEADWGQYVLQSIRFAFDVLNDKYPGGRIKRGRTVVIASSVSNGGGASIRAAEADRTRLIDGVAVGEPNVNPIYGRFAIQQGNQPPFTRHSRTLIDYVTLQNVYVGCAIAAPPASFLLNLFPSPDRCAALKAAGLLSASTLAGQAAEAQAIINDFGILPEQNNLQGVMWTSYVPQSIAMTYANSYGRFSVTDALCAYSFGATDATGTPIPLAPAAENVLFATSNGIPPTGGVNLINNAANKESRVSTPDQNLQGALCLRSLATGQDAATGARLGPIQNRQAARIEEGVEEILATGDLHGTPTLIVTGRSDDILPPNFASRGYVGLNQLREGRQSQVRYVEIKNAQHLDTILTLPASFGIKQLYLPLHRYFVEAMDLMYAHLRDGTPLPPSQVVQTVPRGGDLVTVPAITTANVPPIASNPGANAITFSGRVLYIPE
jgi:hydroxybutyrate-dimer hydrolase